MHPFGKAAPKDFVPMRPFFPIRNSGRIMCPTGKKNYWYKEAKNNIRLVKTMTNTEFAYFIVRSKLPVAMKFL